MLLMLLIGWIVLLPAIVVAGLYIGSTVLGRRRATLNAYEDLFADEPVFETDAPVVTPETITSQAPAAPAAPDHAQAAQTAAAPPVGAGY
jgi:hypothetical protein